MQDVATAAEGKNIEERESENESDDESDNNSEDESDSANESKSPSTTDSEKENGESEDPLKDLNPTQVRNVNVESEIDMNQRLQCLEPPGGPPEVDGSRLQRHILLPEDLQERA